ncbi:hypothetical protein HH799_004836 [Escherichia coli]|nr:hypothetical protein [Escherichia coli]EFI8247363.1 hypothetical protein [Escherichia coli]EFI8703002.1 hypothetical protein [Escherichia coli]EFI8964985.1 hypothetical protein [Escherichia coli]
MLSCPTPETGKSKFSPLPAFLNKKREMVVTGGKPEPPVSRLYLIMVNIWNMMMYQN